MSNQLIPERNARVIPLKYGTVCSRCGIDLVPDQRAWYDFKSKRITCTGCVPENGHYPSESARNKVAPVGGTSALKRSSRDGDRNYRKGAIGEYLVDTHFQRELTDGEVILNDRSVPGSRRNIDHVVIASSGIWVIDAKYWSGKIEYRNAGGLWNEDWRLHVGGSDKTYVTETIFQQVIPVAQLVTDRSIPIHPAVVFVDGNWSIGAMRRILTNRPYLHRGVWISWPRGMSSKIREPGPLSPKSVARIGRELDNVLIPMEG